MIPKSWVPHILLVITNVIYGMNYSIAKIPMPDYIKPLGFVMLRGFAAITFFGVWAFFARKQFLKWEKKDIGLVALCGLLGVCINQLLFFQGLEFTTPVSGAIIMTISPVLVLIYAYFIRKEPFTPNRVFGVFLGMIGALILIVFGNELSAKNAPNPLLGNSLVFINAASYSLYLVLVQPLLKKYPPIQVLSLLFFFGTLMILPFGYNQLMDANWSAMNTNVILAIAFVLVLVSCVTYWFNLQALKTAKPAVVGTYIYTQPFFAAVFAFAIGSDELDAIKLLGAAFIFTAVYLVSKKKKNAPKASPA